MSSLSVYRRPDDPDYKPFEASAGAAREPADLLEPFRRRLVEVPFGLDHPYWIDDPDFDLDFHLRHIAIPPPGDNEQLAAQVARIIGRPMDRARPLWEVYVIEGLEGGDFAVLMKIHHATIDGASGVEMLTMLLDTDPVGGGHDAEADDGSWHPGSGSRAPMEMFNRTIVNLARRPGQGDPAAASTSPPQMGEITRNKGLVPMARTARRRYLAASRSRREDGDGAPRLPPTARAAARRSTSRSRPTAAWPYRLGPLERHQGAQERARRHRQRRGDGGLRRRAAPLPERHDALPADPLMAMIPVSIRTGNEPDKWTNRVSGLVAALPTTWPTRSERVETVHDDDGGGQGAVRPGPGRRRSWT